MADILTIFSEPSTWAALATLVVMEIVLGIDNLLNIWARRRRQVRGAA